MSGKSVGIHLNPPVKIVWHGQITIELPEKGKHKLRYGFEGPDGPDSPTSERARNIVHKHLDAAIRELDAG
jgi:hypothetical protein